MVLGVAGFCASGVCVHVIEKNPDVKPASDSYGTQYTTRKRRTGDVAMKGKFGGGARERL